MTENAALKQAVIRQEQVRWVFEYLDSAHKAGKVALPMTLNLEIMSLRTRVGAMLDQAEQNVERIEMQLAEGEGA